MTFKHIFVNKRIKALRIYFLGPWDQKCIGSELGLFGFIKYPCVVCVTPWEDPCVERVTPWEDPCVVCVTPWEGVKPTLRLLHTGELLSASILNLEELFGSDSIFLPVFLCILLCSL